LEKVARLDVAVNDLSNSDSSSDSDSSSSGEDEGKERRNLPPSLNLSSCSATSSSEQTNISEQALPGQDANLLIKRLEDEQARKRQGSGLSLEQEGEYCSDDPFLKQLLTEGASSSSGPVDPVFVNHEDSQHATHMDSLVFEGIPPEDDMNEPRLDSVCNSNIHSAEGSLVLGGDIEEGELPSSPDPDSKDDEVFAKILEHKVEQQSRSMSKAEKESKIHHKISPLHSLTGDKYDKIHDESASKKKRLKKEKKSRREEKDANKLQQPKKQNLKKFKSSQKPPSDTPRAPLTPTRPPLPLSTPPSSLNISPPCNIGSLSPTKCFPSSHKPSTSAVQKSCDPSKSPSKAPTGMSKLPSPGSTSVKPFSDTSGLKDNSVCPVKNEFSQFKEQKEQVSQSSAHEQAASGKTNQSKVKDKLEEKTPKLEVSKGSCEEVVKGRPVQSKARRISLQDYKAKKEAEKKRKSQEDSEDGESIFNRTASGQESSGSEQNSCTNSETASKEGSPEPAKSTSAPIEEPSETSRLSEQDALLNNTGTTDNDIQLDTTEKDILLDTTAKDILLDTTQEEALDLVEAVSESEMLEENEEESSSGVLTLRDFDVLDELDEESENDTSKESGDESDSLAEDEVDQMLEEQVPAVVGEAAEDIEPEEKLKKLVLEERGGNLFEVLPLGWVAVTHNSGIPLYLHRDTRVVTASRPYDLGNGSVRKHNLPVSAIPCFSYRYSSAVPSTLSSTSASNLSPPLPSSTLHGASSTLNSNPAVCPYSARENVSPDSTTDAANSEKEKSSNADASSEGSNVFPRAQIETIEETMKKCELTPEEITNYCKKIFVFKELEVAKFKTWKERRAYYKQSQKKKIDKLLSNRPVLPEGTKIITIPALEMSSIPGTEGDSAINQKVVKKSKKKWLMNPVGKSMVCLLHEYVQQSLKMQPYYTFTELDNAATPYAAIVHINKIEYGRGTGSSKKIAKSEAAKRTLEMLIPDIKDKLPSMGGGEEIGDGPDLSFFDDIRVEDPRVAELCNRTSEPAPYQILVTCLQRNYGLGDTHIHQELKSVRNGKNEYTMRVDKREVAVICKNKKDGKQLAAAKLLQQLHPHINNWGSLLRMYGNRSIRTLKKKKEKETEVTGLQSRSTQSTVAPSMAILEKLKEEMRNLRDIKKSIEPIGKFVLPSGSSQTGINTDHVDF